jgi:hypothetical protein
MAHLGGHELRAVAVQACADPRTVVRVLRGQPARSTSRARVVAALRALHPALIVPPTPETTAPKKPD